MASSRPDAVTRSGPTRSGPSPPRSESAASLCRFVPIWMSILPTSAAVTANIKSFRSSTQARTAPTATGVNERMSVRGRAAIIQDDTLMLQLTLFVIMQCCNLESHNSQHFQLRPFVKQMNSQSSPPGPTASTHQTCRGLKTITSASGYSRSSPYPSMS